MPAGRPRKTLDDLPENWKIDMMVLATEGGSDVEIRSKVLGNISDDLWYALIEREPEFSRTVKKCKAACEAWWTRRGREMALGSEGNATVWIFNMKNRFDWRDKQDHDVNHGGNVGFSLGAIPFDKIREQSE